LFGGVLIGVLVLLHFLPLFHVLPLKAAREKSAAAAFDAKTFVETFWNDQLLKSTESAVKANDLLSAFRADPANAAKRFGHRLGLSGISSYFVSGSGRIIAVEGGTISIALHDDGTAQVIIKTGPVFGNAIRDGSGLLDVSDFPNSRDFNAISSEINRRVEEDVFPELKQKAAVDVAVRFAGGVDISDGETNPAPLKLVPVVIEFP